ncbi:hypothetical protein RND81_05G246100 [Saponaria officinalis]
MVEDDKWRFYDDCQISSLTRSFRKINEDDDQVGDAKDIEVDTNHTMVRKIDEISYEDGISTKNVNITPPLSPTSYFWPSPPPPPPPPPRRRHYSSIPTKKKTNQTFETIGYGRYKWNDNRSEVRKPKSKMKFIPSPPPPPPPPPPRLPPVVVAHYRESKNSEKKRGGVTITKDFFSSFYHQSKNKGKHKRKSYENLEDLIEPSKVSSIHRSKSTPEFPPQNSIFHTIFPKKVKPKVKLPPPPKKPPTKTVIDDDDDNKIGLGGAGSPWRQIPLPPPPPPPPFKMKPWRFPREGDFVKIKKNNSSSYSDGYCTSEGESSSSPALLFSASPDVNIKADDFIAKFRAKLNLEKSDSINPKQGSGGRSRLRAWRTDSI